MKYGPEDTLNEVFRRSQVLKEKKDKRIIRAMTGIVVALAVLLSASMFLFARGSPVSVRDSAFGAYILSPRAGGYVIVGLICFIAAILLTSLCFICTQRRKEAKEQKDIHEDKTCREKKEK